MNDLVLPVTRYALCGELNIAYQTDGQRLNKQHCDRSWRVVTCSVSCMRCPGIQKFCAAFRQRAEAHHV